MFIVFNKNKIYAYLISLATVITLFVISYIPTNSMEDKTIQTSSNNTVVNEVNNEIEK